MMKAYQDTNLPTATIGISGKDDDIRGEIEGLFKEFESEISLWRGDLHQTKDIYEHDMKGSGR